MLSQKYLLSRGPIEILFWHQTTKGKAMTKKERWKLFILLLLLFINVYFILQDNIDRINYIKVTLISVNFYIIYSFFHLILVAKYLKLVWKVSDHSVYFLYLVRILTIKFEYKQSKLFITLKIFYIQTIWYYFTIYVIINVWQIIIVWSKFVFILQKRFNSCRDIFITYLLLRLSQTNKDHFNL